MNLKLIIAATIVAVTIGFTQGGAAQAAQTISISAQNFMFSPATITVKAGATVTWVNHDEEPHTIFNDAGLFRSSALDTNESFSYTFDKPGTYRYVCTIHPRMTGTIIVE
jgi:plastocyanin